MHYSSNVGSNWFMITVEVLWSLFVAIWPAHGRCPRKAIILQQRLVDLEPWSCHPWNQLVWHNHAGITMQVSFNLWRMASMKAKLKTWCLAFEFTWRPISIWRHADIGYISSKWYFRLLDVLYHDIAPKMVIHEKRHIWSVARFSAFCMQSMLQRAYREPCAIQF